MRTVLYPNVHFTTGRQMNRQKKTTPTFSWKEEQQHLQLKSPSKIVEWFPVEREIHIERERERMGFRVRLFICGDATHHGHYINLILARRQVSQMIDGTRRIRDEIKEILVHRHFRKPHNHNFAVLLINHQQLNLRRAEPQCGKFIEFYVHFVGSVNFSRDCQSCICEL